MSCQLGRFVILLVLVKIHYKAEQLFYILGNSQMRYLCTARYNSIKPHWDEQNIPNKTMRCWLTARKVFGWA